MNGILKDVGYVGVRTVGLTDLRAKRVTMMCARTSTTSLHSFPGSAPSHRAVAHRARSSPPLATQFPQRVRAPQRTKNHAREPDVREK